MGNEKKEKQIKYKSIEEQSADYILANKNIHLFIKHYIKNKKCVFTTPENYWTKERVDFFINKYVITLNANKLPNSQNLSAIAQDEIHKVIYAFLQIDYNISLKLLKVLKKNNLINNENIKIENELIK